eukprot:267874_1
MYPTESPSSFYIPLYFLCKYNDESIKFYTLYMTLIQYGEIMLNATLRSIQSETGHSTNYNDNDMWQHVEWNRAGITNFKMCTIFNDVQLNADCELFNLFDSNDESNNDKHEYIAVGMFGIVADKSVNKYKRYVINQVMSETFKITFESNMNNALNNYKQRRRNLLDNNFEVISIEIIDAFNITNTEYDDSNSNTNNNKHTQMTIILVISIICILFIIVIIAIWIYYSKLKNRKSNADEGKINKQLEMNPINHNDDKMEEEQVEGINVYNVTRNNENQNIDHIENNNDDEIVAFVNQTLTDNGQLNVIKPNNDNDIIDAVNKTHGYNNDDGIVGIINQTDSGQLNDNQILDNDLVNAVNKTHLNNEGENKI